MNELKVDISSDHRKEERANLAKAAIIHIEDPGPTLAPPTLRRVGVTLASHSTILVFNV